MAQTASRALHRLTAALVAVVLIVSPLFLAGCDSSDQKTHVTVGVWDDSVISSGFADYIDSLNPGYDIEWIVGDDSLDFYEYQAEQGSLPDVILTKDFNHVTANTLADSLYDLSGTDLASARSADYLSQVPGNGDRVTYIPGASDFEGILINEYLFNLYQVPVPTDRASFLQACLAFSDAGIKGFVAGMGDPETCYEVMQGFADASLVSDTENVVSQALNLKTGTVTVDPGAFDGALDYVEGLVDQKVIQPDDMTLSESQAEDTFVAGNAAMLFISDGEASTFGERHNMTVRAIPFFGQDTSWAFVEPTFVGAVSDVKSAGVKASTASTEEIHAPAVAVLSSIMSEEAQAKYLSLTGADEVVSAEGGAVDLPNVLKPLQACLEEGRVRLYLPHRAVSHSVGATMQDVVHGETPRDQATTEAMNLLQGQQSKSKKVVASLAEGVSYLFDYQKGNVAASDIAQVVAAERGYDFAVVTPLVARCPLYAGDKTEDELAYPVAPTPLTSANLSGSQVEQFVSACVSSAKNVYELPVVAGLHIVVEETDEGFTLKSIARITQSGPADAQGGQNTTTANEGREQTAPLEPDQYYRVGLSCYDWQAERQHADAYGFSSDEGATLQSAWLSAFSSGAASSLPAYQDYLTFE